MSIQQTNFAAVLLAAGRSSRMGVDKATLLVDGVPLWRRQFDLLRATGAVSIAIAGRSDGPYAGEATVLEDERLGLGPLSGIVSGLRWSTGPLLLVLAVDLPAMTPGFLQGLIASAHPGCGVVPRNERWLEPLAAVYPREALPLAERQLVGSDRSLQHFVRDCESAGLISIRNLAFDELPLFTNVNTLKDWRAST